MDSLFPKLLVSDTLLSQASVAVILNESQATQNQLRSNNPFVLEENLRLNHIGIRSIRLKFNDVGKILVVCLNLNGVCKNRIYI